MLEARLRRMQPLAVTHCAETLAQAIVGATDKLDRALQHSLGKAKKGSRTTRAAGSKGTFSSQNQSDEPDHDD